MRIVLYQPDIPQNTGAILRLAACLGVAVAIVEPCGFWSDARLRRAGLDYRDRAAVTRHRSWAAYRAASQRRQVLLTTRAPLAYTAFAFHPDDALLLGRESAGAPAGLHDAADARIVIPMVAGLRSLNVALAAAMVLGEALRQTGGLPPLAPAERGEK